MENPPVQPFFPLGISFFPFSSSSSPRATVLRVSRQNVSLPDVLRSSREEDLAGSVYLASYTVGTEIVVDGSREIGRRIARSNARSNQRRENGPPSVISRSQPPSQADKLLHPPPAPILVPNQADAPTLAAVRLLLLVARVSSRVPSPLRFPQLPLVPRSK